MGVVDPGGQEGAVGLHVAEAGLRGCAGVHRGERGEPVREVLHGCLTVDGGLVHLVHRDRGHLGVAGGGRLHRGLTVSLDTVMPCPRSARKASNVEESRICSMHRSEPATNVLIKSMSVDTNHSPSAGHHRFGDSPAKVWPALDKEPRKTW